jgi:hypothetical protein
MRRQALYVVSPLAAIVVSLATATASASASRGVAIDLGRVQIEQRLTPGGSYRLPVMGVRNPGTETTSYELMASPLAVDGRKAPPEAWFHFAPATLTLEPQETEVVEVRIDVPTGADAGNYVALVGPKIMTRGGGAQVGAAAASRVTFSVEPATALQAYWLKLKSLLAGQMPWTALLPALAAFSVLAWLLRARFAFRIERRP